MENGVKVTKRHMRKHNDSYYYKQLNDEKQKLPTNSSL